MSFIRAGPPARCNSSTVPQHSRDHHSAARGGGSPQPGRPAVPRGAACCRAQLDGGSSSSSNSEVGQRPAGSLDIEVFETAGTAADATPRGDAAAPSPLAALLGRLDFSEPVSFDGEEKEGYDPLRDGPLRYLGYANELGEAFAAWLPPGGVPLSYAIAISYVLFDTWDKYQRTLAEAQAKLGARTLPPGLDAGRLAGVLGAERGLDTLAWQLIASVAAPGYTIHTVVALARAALDAAEVSGDGGGCGGGGGGGGPLRVQRKQDVQSTSRNLLWSPEHAAGRSVRRSPCTPPSTRLPAFAEELPRAGRHARAGGVPQPQQRGLPPHLQQEPAHRRGPAG